MKTKLTLLTALASLGALAGATAQTAVTPAAGYHTVSVKGGGKLNLIGINVGNAVSAAGDFDADSANDTDVDFTTLLTAATPYTVQNITTGAFAAVDSWTANDLTTIPALPVTTGDKYEIRQDQTVADIFGASNESGLEEGSEDTADALWIPDGTGAYTRIFWNNLTTSLPARTPGWRVVQGSGTADAGGTVIPFHLGIFLQRRGATDVDFVFTGHVRGDDDTDGHGAQMTVIDVAGNDTLNVLNRIVPVEITVAESGIALAPGNEDTSDILWIPNGDGISYTRIYNNNVTSSLPARTPGLRIVQGSGTADASGELLRSGYIVQRRDVDGQVAISVPPTLDL